MITLFSFTSFRLKPHLYLGIESSESISTGLFWINITENQIKKNTSSYSKIGYEAECEYN